MHAHWHRTQDMQYAPRVLHFSAFHFNMTCGGFVISFLLILMYSSQILSCDCTGEFIVTCRHKMSLPAYVTECASREELESLKNDLHYWQNATLKMMMNVYEKGNTHMIML